MKHFETYTRMTSPFGPRKSPISGKEEFHTGIDLVKADRGEIYCTVPGRVVHAKMAVTGSGIGGFGNTVCIVDKNQHLHLYGHLDSVACKVGDQLAKGDVVGYQGNTGQSAGSHLHYEIRSKTAPSLGWKSHIDPIAYLDKYWAENTPKDWKEEGLEFLQKEYGLSDKWKATDPIDMGTLGIILRRKPK